MVSKISSVFRSLVGSDGPTNRTGPRKRALERDPDNVDYDVLESPQVKRAKSSHQDLNYSRSSSISISSPTVAFGKVASWIKGKTSSFAESYIFRQPGGEGNTENASGRHRSQQDALTRRPIHEQEQGMSFFNMSARNRTVNEDQRPNHPQHSDPRRTSHHGSSHMKGNQQSVQQQLRSNQQRQQQRKGNYNSGLPPGARSKYKDPTPDVILVNGNGHGDDNDDDDVQEIQHQFRVPMEMERNKTTQRQHSSTQQAVYRSHVPRSTQTAVPSSKPTYRTHNHPDVSRSYQPVAEKLFPQQRKVSPGRGQRQRSNSSRSNSSRVSTANECIRLTEKQRYQDLLQQFTSNKKYKIPLSTSVSSHASSSVLESSRIEQKHPPPQQQQQQFTTDIGSLVRKPIVHHHEPNVPSGSRILPHQYNTKREIREAARLRLHVPVSELSPKGTPGVRPSAMTPAQPDFSAGSRPESPVITAIKHTPRSESRGVSPMTVFERSLRESPYALEDWVKNMKDKFESNQRLKTRQVEEQELRVKLHEERRLRDQSKLIDRIREQMTISEKVEAVIDDPIFIEDEEEEDIEEIEELEEEEEELVELTPEMEDEIDAALVPHPPNETLLEGFKLLITRHDIQTLNGLNWLNDEVINFYMQLIMARSQEDGFPNVHCFNTFFYPKLLKGGQPSLRRWTKRVDIFAKDLICVPVHLGMHWCMSIVDFRSKSITYYDSMGSHNRRCLEALRDYLRAEHQDKKGSPYEMNGWSYTTAKDIPQQLNGSDCGMFASKFANISQGAQRLHLLSMTCHTLEEE
ncbi:uncharacterized protein [Amphiura filiformis]|uniref:uncharacterized protein n=1 Tax=Amphiura filiformis TaxID=82378 RepID=UPI003B20EEA1